MDRSTRGWIVVASSLCVAALVSASCGVDPPGALTDDDTGSGGAADGPDPKLLFDALEPQLYTSCGSCHDLGGIANSPFLAGPDVYHTIVGWPDYVVIDPSLSRLLNYPRVGSMHIGNDLDEPDLASTLLPEVQAWLAAEAEQMQKAGKMPSPTVGPFPVNIGFNVVFLDPLGSDFKGMALAFNADLLTPTTLSLTELEVHPTPKHGVHVVHPLFSVLPEKGALDPDPVDSFSNVDAYYAAGDKGPLGPGTLILGNWAKNAELSVSFEKIEPYGDVSADGGTDGGPTGGCIALDAFETSAAPRFQLDCIGCHGGKDPLAQGALDMAALATDPAAACAQIKARVSPADPAMSAIFLTTDPALMANHPFHFQDDEDAFHAFESAVTTWIAAEKGP